MPIRSIRHCCLSTVGFLPPFQFFLPQTLRFDNSSNQTFVNGQKADSNTPTGATVRSEQIFILGRYISTSSFIHFRKCFIQSTGAINCRGHDSSFYVSTFLCAGRYTFSSACGLREGETPSDSVDQGCQALRNHTSRDSRRKESVWCCQGVLQAQPFHVYYLPSFKMCLHNLMLHFITHNQRSCFPREVICFIGNNSSLPTIKQINFQIFKLRHSF